MTQLSGAAEGSGSCTVCQASSLLQANVSILVCV